MVSAVTQTTSTAGTAAASNALTSKDTPKQLVSKEAFLQLLVEQIKHQDPLNPADGTQFMTQLAQFSELEQMINVNSQLEAIQKALAAPADGDSAVTPPPSSSNGG